MHKLMTIALLLGTTLVTAQERFFTEYQAVDEITQINFNTGIENNLKTSVESYLGEDSKAIFKVKSQLRLAKQYRIISEENQKLSKQQAITPLSPTAPKRQVLTNNPLTANTLIEENSRIVSAGDSNEIADSLPLPGAPLLENNNNQNQQQTSQNQLRSEVRQQSNAQLQQLQLLQQQLNQLQQQIQQQTQEPAPSQLETLQIDTIISTRQELVAENIEIQNLSIKAWIPDTITPVQERLINELIIEKANINFIRGDQLEIIKINYEPPTSAHQKAPNDLLSKLNWENLANQAIDWLIPFLGLLILLLLWWLLSRRNYRRQPITYTSYPTDAATYPPYNLPPVEASAQLPYKETSNIPTDDYEEQQQKSRFDALSDEITSTIILGDDLLAQYLQNVVGDDSKLSQIACIQHVLGNAVFNKYAKNNVSFQQLEALPNFAQMSIAEQRSVAAETLQDLVGIAQNALIDRNRPFHFLNKMSNQQLLYLLSKENAQTQALLLSQLDSQRLAGIISQLPAESQGQVAVEIGKLTDLPLESYQKMANYLARKASQIPDFKEVNIDSDEVIIRTLEEMDTAGENTILNSLREKNPEQFYRIKKSYISFTDLPRIQITGLKNLLRELERETIATALYDEEEAFRQFIIEALPSRSQILITQLLKTMTPPTSSEIIEKKKEISRHARGLLKANVISLREEEQ